MSLARVSTVAGCLVALAVFARSTPATALCAGGTSFGVFPPTGEALPTNGRIVLELVGFEGLDGQSPWWPMELRSGTERIALNEVASFVGASRVRQVVLQPARGLRPNARYELYASDEHLPMSVRPGSHAAEPFAWTTSAAADHTVPRWRSAPRSGAGVYRLLGCGTEVSVGVSVSVGGEEPVQLLAEVTPAGSVRAATYMLRPRNGQVEIGHDMCSGPFDLEPGRHYSLRLTAVDAAGNRSPAPGRPSEIMGPLPDVLSHRSAGPR